ADPSQRASRDTICPALWRNRCSTSSLTSGRSPGRSAEMTQVLDLADLEDAGAIEMRVVREHLQHLFVALGLDEPEAAHDLLRLDVGPVGHHHLSILAAQDAAFPRPQLLRMQHAAGRAEVRVPAHVLLDHLLDFLWAQRAWYPRAASNDQIFRHGWHPFRLKDDRGHEESTGRRDYGTPSPYPLPQGERGVGELRELRPDDHTRARAPGEGRHVGEHLGRALGEGHGKHPGHQLRCAPPACFLHSLERAVAKEPLVIALLEEIQEPEVELLVHPEVTRSTWLVGEAARGEDGDALPPRIGLEHLAQRGADLIGALWCGNGRHRAVH